MGHSIDSTCAMVLTANWIALGPSTKTQCITHVMRPKPIGAVTMPGMLIPRPTSVRTISK